MPFFGSGRASVIIELAYAIMEIFPEIEDGSANVNHLQVICAG